MIDIRYEASKKTNTESITRAFSSSRIPYAGDLSGFFCRIFCSFFGIRQSQSFIGSGSPGIDREKVIGVIGIVEPHCGEGRNVEGGWKNFEADVWQRELGNFPTADIGKERLKTAVDGKSDGDLHGLWPASGTSGNNAGGPNAESGIEMTAVLVQMIIPAGTGVGVGVTNRNNPAVVGFATGHESDRADRNRQRFRKS
jgi:hypothetical protein